MKKQLTAADFTEVVTGEGYWETANKYYGIQAPHNGYHTGATNGLYVIYLSAGNDNSYSAATAETLQGAIDLINAEYLEDEADITPVTMLTQAEALAQLANIVRVFSATQAAELLAEACGIVAKDAELDTQDVAFLEAAEQHLKWAAEEISAC